MVIRRSTLGPLALGILLSSCASVENKAAPQQKAVEAKASNKLLDEANQYARDGLLREAIVAFTDYLEKNDSDAAAHRTLGIIYVKSGAYKLGEEHLEKAAATYPGNFDLNFYLGEACRMQKHYADAIYHYKRALETEPKNIAALKTLSWSYYNIRFYSEALRTSKQLRKLAPNDFQVAIIMARVLNKISMNDKALLLLNRAEALASPDNIPFLNSVKGDILLSNGDRQAAENAYRKALQDQPLLPGALAGLARKLIDDNKKEATDLAIVYLDRALRLRPSLTEVYYLLGNAYQRSNPDKAQAYYKTFVKEASYDPEFQKELDEVRTRLSSIKTPKKGEISVSRSEESL